MPFVLGQWRNAGGDCPCCEHNADAGRTHATIELLQAVQMPHDWTLDEALEYPLDQEWHETHFLDTREKIRNLEEPEARNYPLRQAALAAAILEYAPWDTPTKNGVTWGCIRLGMRYHGWKPTYNPASIEFLLPEPDLFERHNGVLGLSALIYDAYTLNDEDRF